MKTSRTSDTSGVADKLRPAASGKPARRTANRPANRSDDRLADRPTQKSARPSADPASVATDSSDPATQRLADFLCFAVYSANLAFGRAYRPILDELGLTYTQYITIIVLWEMGSVTVSALGERLFLESNTLTPILKKLEAMGYLQRRRDASDERQVLVSLTDAGRALRENAFGRSLVDATGLNAEEFAKLQKAVIKLRDNLIKSARPE